MNFWSIRLLSISIICLIVSACAGQKTLNTSFIKQQSTLVANTANITPEQAIKQAEKEYAEAQEAELDIYAPLHLEQSLKNINLAKEMLTQPKSMSQSSAITTAITAQKLIDNGYTNKKTVEENLTSVVKHHKELLNLNAPSLNTLEYQKIHTQLLDLVKLVEVGQITDAIHGQTPLLTQMSQLEIHTLKIAHLGEAEELVEKIKDNNAENYAKNSFQQVNELIRKANIFITKNYRNRKAVKKTGKEALWAAKHAYFVAIESKKINELDSSQSEQYVLAAINHQNQLSQIISSSDLPPQPISTSHTNLLKAIGELKAKLETSQKELSSALSSNTLPLFNKKIVAEDDDITVLHTYPATTKEDEALFPEQAINDEEPRFQVDEQGFDDIEQMTDENGF